MKLSQIILFIALFFFAFTYINAQTGGPKNPVKSKEQIELEEKAFDLLGNIIEESATLKLPENRILVYSTVSNLLWKKDNKFARQLARNAANEFVQLQNLPEYSFQADEANYRFYISNNLRGQMIYSLTNKDAEFALELLYATRSPEIADAVQNYQQIIANTGKNPNSSNFKQEESNKLNVAKREIETEQRIKREVSKKDPQKLIENIRESFAKDLNTYQILFDIEELNKKDHDLAQKLLNEIMSELAQTDFPKFSGKSTLTYFVYNRFLKIKKENIESNQDSDNNDKDLKFAEKIVKAIASNEIDYFLKEKTLKDSGNFLQKAIYLKQILPERFREIEKLFESIEQQNGRSELIERLEISVKLGENPTLEQIAENSSKLPPHVKEGYYRNAIGKLLETESAEKIAQKIEQIPDFEEKEKIREYLKSLSVGKNNEQMSLSEAVNAINEIKSENERVLKLINLAVFYHQKKTEESQKIAEELMNEAQKLVKIIPETETEYEVVLPVIWGSAKIGLTKTFDLLTPVVQQSNEIIDAYVLYTSYQDRNYPYSSKKEIIFASQDTYNSFKSKYKEISKMLAQIDFERTTNLINNFQRADVKIMAKLIIAESILEN